MTLFLELAALALLGLLVLIILSGIRVIPNTRIGIVEKRFSGKGSVKSGFIAQNGEAGFQPHVLRGGIHYLRPLQYIVHMAPLVTILRERLVISLPVMAGCLIPPRCSPPTSR